MKIIVVALIALSCFAQAPGIGSGIWQPSTAQIPTYAQAGGSGSPNGQPCISGYNVVQYTSSGQTQIYSCGATTPNQYGIAPAAGGCPAGGCPQAGAVQGTTTASFTSPQTLTGVTISGWGDSLTAGNEDGTGNTYPLYLATDMATTVNNYGVGGQTSTQIATRFLATPSTFGQCNIIWAGRNNYSAQSTVLADVASMVAAMTAPKCFLVMSVLNGAGETSLQNPTNYAQIIALNKALAAAYPNNYLDIRNIIVQSYNPNLPQDVADHAVNVSPSSLRAVEVQGTITAALTSVATSVNISGTTNGVGSVVIVDSEQMLITAVTGSTLTVVRGYNTTTAVSHASGANYSTIDGLHLGYNGYQIVAQQVAAWLSNPQTLSPAVGGYYPVQNPLFIIGQSGVSTSAGVAQINGLTVSGPAVSGEWASIGLIDKTKSTYPIAVWGAQSSGCGSLLSLFNSTYFPGGAGNDVVDFVCSQRATFYEQIQAPSVTATGSTPFISGFTTVKSGSSSNTDLTGELSFSSATTASYTFAGSYSSHPECWVTPQFNAALQPWVTYTSTTSFTINFATAVTGTVSYSCVGRN